jgi:uncharacterized protein (UPF0333 family)
MIEIYSILGGLVALIAAFVGIYYKGKAVKSSEQAAIEVKNIQKATQDVQEVKNTVSNIDRKRLIDELSDSNSE